MIIMGIFKRKPNRLKPQNHPPAKTCVPMEDPIPLKKRFIIDGYTDELFPLAVDVVINSGCASISMLQRRMKLGYGRAARLIDEMEKHGLIGEFNNGQPRMIIATNFKEIEFIRGEQKAETLNMQDNNIVALENDFFKYGGTEAEILSIDLMDGHRFERWCSEILLKNGFESAKVTPGSGDYGVDVVAIKDGIHYAIQCKCYSGDLGNTPIQEVYAGKEMYKCQVGVVMTNRYFTAGAKQLAEQTRVLLWDRDKLKELINSAI